MPRLVKHIKIFKKNLKYSVGLFKGEYEVKVFDSDGGHLETHKMNIDAPESCSSLREHFHEFEKPSDLNNFILFEFGGTTYDIVRDCYFENCVRISNRGVSFN